MLRIIEQQEGHSLTFRLAGKLVRDWTPELEHCWRRAAETHSHGEFYVDLTEMTFVDEAGKRLLAAMANAGVQLIAADVLMKALVEQIARGQFSDDDGIEVPP